MPSEEIIQTVKALRKGLKRFDNIQDGTVLRLTVEGNYGVVLTYAALWVADANKWYLTGVNSKPKDHEQFITWLIREAISIEIASEWLDL